MNIPKSMRAELTSWNNGAGINLEMWIGCEGRFSLAVGYITIFWPEFVEFEGYILQAGFSESALLDFAKQEGCTRKSVEWLNNHLHLADIQHRGCKDISSDKLFALGSVLKEIYSAKLEWQFPENPCIVELYVPEDTEDFDEYQLSFWQSKHDLKDA